MKKRERGKQWKASREEGKERGRKSKQRLSFRKRKGRGVFCGLGLIFEQTGIASGPIARQCFVHFPDSK